MAVEVIKPEVVVGAVLGALKRDVVLPQLIWLDPAGDFKGAKNDTISLSIPAFTSARRRVMRSGSARTRDALHEGKTDVTLSTNLYKDVPISDEEMTLDIKDFGRQVLQPISTAMVEGWEEEIVDLMTEATYHTTITWDPDDPHGCLADAAMALDDARVPQTGRGVVLGSGLANQFVKSDQMRRADSAGAAATTALQKAMLAETAGFTIVKCPALPRYSGYAFHRTAYAASSKVPEVPASVGWGTAITANGFTMRAIRDFDSSATGWVDILGFDAFVGSNIVKDHGAFDSNGMFIPSADPDNEADSDALFVRAVEFVGSGS